MNLKNCISHCRQVYANLRWRRTYHRDQVTISHRRAHITVGYRGCNLTYLECIFSCFAFNNECINVWLCLINCIYLTVRIIIHLFRADLVNDLRSYPIMCYAIGALSYFTTLLLSHVLSARSESARDTVMLINRSSITLFYMGVSIVLYYFSRPAMFPFMQFYLYACAIVAILATNLINNNIYHRHINITWLRTVRLLMYSWMIIATYLFLIIRFMYCMPHDCNWLSLPLFTWQILSWGMIVLFYYMRFPEYYWPGTFDRLGQSRHWIYIFTFVFIKFQMDALVSDITERVEMTNLTIPNIYSTYFLMLVVFVHNAGLIWYQIKKDSNKSTSHQNTLPLYHYST